MNNNAISLHINFDDPSAERMAISQCAKFVRRRIADTQAAEAWIACGERLAALKQDLLRKKRRGDNERVGWYQAFLLEPKEFPFDRRHADKLIDIYQFFQIGHMWPIKKLPASMRALQAMAASKFTVEIINQCIADDLISPGSTDVEIMKLAKKFKLTTGKQKSDPKSTPKRKRIATVLALMKRLDLTLEDLTDGRSDR